MFFSVCPFKINTWLIYPFYCFKGSFDRSLMIKELSRNVFHCSVIMVLCLATAFIVYHFVSALSRTFFIRFSCFFISICFRSILGDNSFILPPGFHFVNRVFAVFFIFSPNLSLSPPVHPRGLPIFRMVLQFLTAIPPWIYNKSGGVVYE